MTTYRIRSSQLRIESARFVTDFCVESVPDLTTVVLVQVGVPVSRARPFFPADNGQTDEAALRKATALYALPRIEAGLRDGAYDSYAGMDAEERIATLNPVGDEVDALARAGHAKQCRYQTPIGGELFCEASLDLKTTKRQSAPTSAFLCRGCPVPDDRWICSHLHHARVVPAGTNPFRWSMSSAMCDLGHQKQSSEWGACHYGGHDCWERVVEATGQQDFVPLSPLTLHEAIGYLDFVWRDVFEKKPLVDGTLLQAGGMLGTPCKSAQDFGEKLKALVDVFDALQVDGKKGRSLERMTEFLRDWASSRGVAREDFAPVEDTISVLRMVPTVRANLEHSAAKTRGEFEAAQRALGIRLPAISYAEEWGRLVARVVEKLRVVREFLRKHAEVPT